MLKAIEVRPTADSHIGEALALLGKGAKSVREMRTLIMGLEAAMFAMPGHMTQEDFNTTHHFESGTYVRELFIPKDTVLTGRIHKHAHLNILSQGKITVWTEDGMKTLTASTVIPSQAGLKRVGYAHEDSIWITVHQNPTDDREIKSVEDRLFCDTFDEAYLTSDRSFEAAVRFLGVSPEQLGSMGEGAFASKDYATGDIISPSVVARVCNHSGKPNAQLVVRDGGEIDLIALRPIQSGEEILNDYYLDFERMSPLNKEIRLCLP